MVFWGNFRNIYGKIQQKTGFVDFYDEPCQTTGYFMRGDWLDKLGLDAYEYRTFDEWHDVLMAVKTAGFENCEWPLQIYSNIDAYANVWNDFNTSPYAAGPTYTRVVDGKVYFNGTTDEDLVLMQYLKGWFDDGIISPYFQSLSGLEDITADVTNGNCGCAFFNPSEIAGTESSCVNPEARFDVLPILVRQRGNIIHRHLLRTDVNTFFSENYVLFLLGDKSFAEWDDFQKQLAALGQDQITQIYQDTYDAYMANA